MSCPRIQPVTQYVSPGVRPITICIQDASFRFEASMLTLRVPLRPLPGGSQLNRAALGEKASVPHPESCGKNSKLPLSRAPPWLDARVETVTSDAAEVLSEP